MWCRRRFVFDAVRHGDLKIVHGLDHCIGNGNCVGTRCLEHWNGDGRFAVEQGAQRIIGCTKLDPGNVPQPGDLTVFTSTDNDVAELFRCLKTTLRIDAELNVDTLQVWRSADNAAAACTFC